MTFRSAGNVKTYLYFHHPPSYVMITMKCYNTSQGLLLAACDSEIVGKKFKEGKLRIEVTKSFYGEEKVSEKVFLNHLRNAVIVNLVGERVVNLAVKNGFADEETVIKIQGIPHVQILKLI